MKDDIPEPVFIYGRHAVLEAVQKRPDVVLRVFLREDLLHNKTIYQILKSQTSLVTFKGNGVPRGVDRSAVHQGLIAEIAIEKLVIPFKKFVKSLEVTSDTALVILGEVQDPHNVGAIIRSAVAFGVKAVLIPEHRGCPVTGTVIKTSAGMAFDVPLVGVGNINSAIRDLKAIDFWIYGLAGGGETSLSKEQFTKPSAFIVGNEAKGLRLKTHEACDSILTIPINKNAESLNASVAVAVTLYQWSTQHQKVIKMP